MTRKMLLAKVMGNVSLLCSFLLGQQRWEEFCLEISDSPLHPQFISEQPKGTSNLYHLSAGLQKDLSTRGL